MVRIYETRSLGVSSDYYDSDLDGIAYSQEEGGQSVSVLSILQRAKEAKKMLVKAKHVPQRNFVKLSIGKPMKKGSKQRERK